MDAEKLAQIEQRIKSQVAEDDDAPGDPQPKEPARKTLTLPKAEPDEPKPDDEPAIEETPPEPQADHDEVEARKAGWVPQEEWKGDKSLWVSAKVFRKNGELYDSLKSLKRKAEDQDGALRNLAEQNRKLTEALKKRAAEEKLRERDEAIKAADPQAVRKLDEDLKKLDEEFGATEAPKQPETVAKWIEANPWFNEDPLAHEAAKAYYGKLGGDKDMEANLAKTRDYIKKRMPDLFPSEQETKPEPKHETRRLSSVEAPSRAAPGKKKFTRADLNAEQKRVHDRLTRSNFMTSDEYITSLIETGELK